MRTSGNEELRYWSLNFQNKDTTLAGLNDLDLVTDAEGFVTIIIGFGTPPPEWVTPANGYTYFDMAQVPDHTLMTDLNIRTILPAPSFHCGVQSIGYRTGEYTSLGGFMGEYAPTVDFLSGNQIPQHAEPLREVNACGILPPEPPVLCTTFYPPPSP